MSRFDLLCWELVKVNFVITEFLLTLVVPYIKDQRLSYKIQMYLISLSVLKTMNLEDIPSVARDKVIKQGRLLFFIILGGFLMNIYL